MRSARLHEDDEPGHHAQDGIRAGPMDDLDEPRNERHLQRQRDEQSCTKRPRSVSVISDSQDGLVLQHVHAPLTWSLAKVAAEARMVSSHGLASKSPRS